MLNQKEWQKTIRSVFLKNQYCQLMSLISYLTLTLMLITACSQAGVENVEDESDQSQEYPPLIDPLPEDNSAVSDEPAYDEAQEEVEVAEEEIVEEEVEVAEEEIVEEEVEVAEEDDVACTAGVECLLACDLDDQNCRLDCVRNSSLSIRGIVNSAGLCIANSGCSTDDCIFVTCSDALAACPGSNQDTCNATQQCLENCQGDMPCAVNCAYEADQQAKNKLSNWTECLSEEQCDTLDCGSCPIENLCLEEIAPSIHSCSELNYCVNQCAGQHQCQNDCLSQAPQNVVDEYSSLQACDVANSCNQSSTCQAANCRNEMLQCGLELSQPSNPADITIENCMDLNLCVEDCPSRTASCISDCEYQASQEAVSLYRSLISCIQAFQCTTRDCLSTHCQNELYICAFH